MSVCPEDFEKGFSKMHPKHVYHTVGTYTQVEWVYTFFGNNGTINSTLQYFVKKEF